MRTSLYRLATIGVLAAAMTGCAAPKKVDYSAFRQAKPASILVLPPLNESTDVNASFSDIKLGNWVEARYIYSTKEATKLSITR